jgi:hypothetical protein
VLSIKKILDDKSSGERNAPEKGADSQVSTVT